MEKAGVPAVTICTDIFAETAHAMAQMWGAPDYPVILTTHPLSGLTRQQLRQRAERMLEEMVTILAGA